jgi:hypothetical protein
MKGLGLSSSAPGVEARSATRGPASPKRPKLLVILLSAVSLLMAALAVLAFITARAAVSDAADASTAAHLQGYDEGRSAGVAAGHSQAEVSLQRRHDQELAEATLSAYNAGAEFAYPSGVADGRSAGYEEGYAAGYAQGASEGYSDGFRDGQQVEPELTVEERIAEYDKALRCMIDPTQWICSQD